MSTTRMTTAIIYARFSPRRHASTSESNKTQRELCERLAKKKGYTVGGFHEDIAVSGADVHKAGLEAAIAQLGKGDVLLVYKRDRIARDVLLAELARRQVKSKGATIEAVTGDVDGEGPYIKMVRQVMDAVAELERAVISERTKHAMQRHQRAGRRMGRYAPYGQQIDPVDSTKLIPNGKEEAAIWCIMREYGTGKTPHAIAARMNRTHPEVARTGKWNAKTVAKIIKREKAGK